MHLGKIPIIQNKFYNSDSVFTVANLLREAMRQKKIKKANIPEFCVLDPDGDLTEYLLKHNLAEENTTWCCYHTKLYVFKIGDFSVGIIPFVVGASFAVLVAEEVYCLGCKLMFLLTSSGKLTDKQLHGNFYLIEKAIRDEGVSYHYLAPSTYSYMNERLLNVFKNHIMFKDKECFAVSWTTDAPFRETTESINAAVEMGADLVEMEAAGLYAFAETANQYLVCIAHVTNEMGQTENDFEKGDNNGSNAAMNILDKIIKIFVEEKAQLEMRIIYIHN